MDVEARKRGAKQLMDEMAKLQKENKNLFAQAVAAQRDKQVAEAKVAGYDRRELVKVMREGSFITFPEDEPSLGVTAGETFQKRNGRLVKCQTIGGQPVIHNTSNRGGRSLDFATELSIKKGRA
jgi:hypothetical protein